MARIGTAMARVLATNSLVQDNKYSAKPFVATCDPAGATEPDRFNDPPEPKGCGSLDRIPRRPIVLLDPICATGSQPPATCHQSS